MNDIRKVPDWIPTFPARTTGGEAAPADQGQNQWKRCPGGGQGAALPFYMTYPMPMTWEEEDTAARDLEYLIQLYPRQAKKYQEKISRLLDRMDYSGSVIYDEYPDRLTLYKLADGIWEGIRREEDAGEAENGQAGAAKGPEYWENLRELVLILLYYEIFRRRRERDASGMDGIRRNPVRIYPSRF